MVSTSIIAGGAFGLAAVGTGLALRMLTGPLQPFGVPVLRYRFVGPPLAGSPFNPVRVNTPIFHSHLRYMARRGFRPVTLSEAYKRSGERRFLREKPVVLTFDGGYESLERYVLPSLREYGFNKATAFVASDAVGRTNLYETGGRGRPDPMLTEEGLKALSDFGFEIGSLGKRAPDLSRLSHEELHKELKESRETLQEMSGQSIELLAYPRDVNISHNKNAVKQAGYKAAAWISLEGILSTASPGYCLPRFPLSKKSRMIEVALILANRMI